MRVSYCRECDYYQEERADSCPECGRAMVRRDFNYPEDVFGPPDKADRPRQWPPDKRRGSVGAGVGILFLLHLLQFPLTLMTEGISVFFIGVTRMAYVLPALIVFGVMKKGATAGGIAMGAGITFLLNAACFGVICGSVA